MPWLLYCFYSCIIDECEHLLSFFYKNLSDFSVNFCLSFSCAVRLKCLFQTCCYFAFESFICRLFVNPVTVPKSHRQLLLSFLWIHFISLCCISWNMESQARPHISALISAALPSLTMGHSSLSVYLGLADILMSSFCGEVHV